MIVFLLAQIGIPLLAGLVLLVFEWAASKNPISWDECNGMGLDFAILSIGASGAIFINPRLLQHWGQYTPVYGIVTVLANLLLAAILVLRRRWRAGPVDWKAGMLDLFLGVLSLSLICGVFYFGYGAE